MAYDRRMDLSAGTGQPHLSCQRCTNHAKLPNPLNSAFYADIEPFWNLPSKKIILTRIGAFLVYATPLT